MGAVHGSDKLDTELSFNARAHNRHSVGQRTSRPISQLRALALPNSGRSRYVTVHTLGLVISTKNPSVGITAKSLLKPET